MLSAFMLRLQYSCIKVRFLQMMAKIFTYIHKLCKTFQDMLTFSYIWPTFLHFHVLFARRKKIRSVTFLYVLVIDDIKDDDDLLNEYRYKHHKQDN